MQKRILAMMLIVALLFSCVPLDAFAAQRDPAGFTEALQKKCGLCPLKELPAPEAVDSLGADYSIMEDLSPGQTEEFLEWENYGTKFIYNQLGKQQKRFWNALDALSYSYLSGKKNAKNYQTWHGTEFVSYEGLSSMEAQKILMFFLYSNPQYYFFMPGYSVRESSAEKGAVAIQFDERVVEGNARFTATKKIKKEIEACVAHISGEETELEKEKAAHDLICGRVVYDYDLSDENVMRNQTIYSVFLTDKTVCAGYSQAMELLCNAVGIDCIAVTSEMHQWNMLRLNDIWYCIDLTWDDGNDGEVYYRFFNRSAQMLLDLEGGEEQNHLPQDQWNGYLPSALRDSGADDRDIGTVYMPEKRTAVPEITVSGSGIMSMRQEEGTEIYYTTDGGVPSVARSKSERYTGRTGVGERTVIQAMASKRDCRDSEVVEFEWPVKTVRAYAGHPYVFYSRLEGVAGYQAEGLDRLDAGKNPAFFDELSGKLRWNPAEGQIGEIYEILFSAKDSDGRLLTEKINVQICDFTEEESGIAGTEELILQEGYAATGSGSFAVTGDKQSRKIKLTGNTGSGKAQWNEEDCQIDIASGLTEGIYDMALEIVDEKGISVRPFRLKIVASKEQNHLPEFQSPGNIVRAYPGTPLVFFVKARDEDPGDQVELEMPDLSHLEGVVQFDADSGKFSWIPEESMLGETRRVTFYASDKAGGLVHHKVDIQVVSPMEEQIYAVEEDSWLNAFYSGQSKAYGNDIFLRANRDAAGELGQGQAAVGSGNKLMLLKFYLDAFPAVERAKLYLTYICKNSNVMEKNNGQLRVAVAEGFSWSENTVTWREWDAWRQKENFSISSDMVAESERYELGETGKSPGLISVMTQFQGVKVTADITEIVRETLQRGKKELTLLVNTKEEGEEFFVSREGADSESGFTFADVSMSPSIGLDLPLVVTGPEGMTLVEGYGVAETDSFSILGTERETEVSLSVSNMSDQDAVSQYQDYVEWNRATRQLKIREGLPEGHYRILLSVKEKEGREEAKNQAAAHFDLNILKDRRPELEKLCKEAENMDWKNFTGASWAKYQSALLNAESVLHAPADAYKVDMAILLLRNAQDALETLQDVWARLSALYLRKDSEEERYTPASWQVYQAAVAGLKKLPEGILEEEMYLRLAELKSACQSLAYIADKRALKILLDMTDTLKLSFYTPETVAYLKKMRDEARVVYGNANAMQSEVDEAYNHLWNARKGLVLVQIKEPKLRNNQKYTDTKKGISYQVTSVSQKTVKVKKGKKKNMQSVVIPATVKIDGVKCKVTEIGENAFKGYQKLKMVTMGKNVKKIGKKSFYNCKNLSKLIIKATKINTVKANAFGNTAKKARLVFLKKMSAKQKKALRKKLGDAGLRLDVR